MSASSDTGAQRGSRANTEWDEVVDVVVVGYGAAGAAAAAAAADTGAHTLLLEKMAFPGGLSIASAGGIRISDDADQAFAYLKATCGGRTPDDLLRVLADGMVLVADHVREIGELCDADVSVAKVLGNYPLPGFESLGYCEVTRVPAIEGGAYHGMSSISNGTRLFRVLETHVIRAGVEVRMKAPARRLLRDEHGRVAGLLAEIDGEARRIRSRGGVILTCGGFEADREMQRQYLQADPVLTASFRGNTGDGIRMAQAVGADLWHMWHYHGPYGLKHPSPDYPFALLLKAIPMWTPGRVEEVSMLSIEPSQGRLGDKRLAEMAWIVVDQGGRRFMNEYPPYPGDAGVRPFDTFDFLTQKFPRNPAFMIFDENGRKMYPMGRAVHNDHHPRYVWSADNLDEVENGIFDRAGSIEELAGKIGADPGELCLSLDIWNAAVAAGNDREFGRLPETMVPILTPPFYFGRVYPVVINTQGGPRHDVGQRVVDPFGEPIPGLYAAGELGSLFGHLYMSGGNLAECIIGGRIAGRNAAGEAAASGYGA